MQWNFYIFYLINFNHFLETNLTQIDLKKKHSNTWLKSMHLTKFLYSWNGCSVAMEVFTEFCTWIINYFLMNLPTMCTQNSMMELKLGKKWAIYLLWWLTSFDFPLLPHYTILSFLVFFIKVILCFHSYLYIWTNTL